MHSPLRWGSCLVHALVAECATLMGSLRPRSSTEKHVCLSVMYSVPWNAIWGGTLGEDGGMSSTGRQVGVVCVCMCVCGCVAVCMCVAMFLGWYQAFPTCTMDAWAKMLQ